MKSYLVGGAVRDLLLERPIKDKDWVVVGATVEQMLEHGFTQVGKDFPVFLHPKTKEEYALARTERKVAAGYTGFDTRFTPDVTLQQDLERRDITINAMAKDDKGDIIDPYGGLADLENRVIRHVSDAFIEDPLRVLRVARFAARYHRYGFRVAEETKLLMQTIAASGELETLSAERVWVETEKALSENNPEVYFQILRDCDALGYWFKELNALWGIPNPAKWHPEIDTGVHTMMVLEQSVRLSDSISVRFAALCHDYGKGITPESMWPSHRGHEQKGLPLVKAFCQRLKVPNACKELALMTCEHHGNVHRAKELKASTIIKLFDKCDAWRKPERFLYMLLACRADARGRTGFEDIPYQQVDYLAQCLSAASSLSPKSIIDAGFKGAEIKQQLTLKRTDSVAQVKSEFQFNEQE
ncbi:MAG: multifunctional CCA addition/repair protein [Alteromonadaceae bacterium]|nr:multifunctional CCA addition/repair protein [Alteromonadaceae bacterium]